VAGDCTQTLKKFREFWFSPLPQVVFSWAFFPASKLFRIPFPICVLPGLFLSFPPFSYWNLVEGPCRASSRVTRRPPTDLQLPKLFLRVVCPSAFPHPRFSKPGPFLPTSFSFPGDLLSFLDELPLLSSTVPLSLIGLSRSFPAPFFSEVWLLFFYLMKDR